MAKKKSATLKTSKSASQPSKQSLDDFLSHWSDDDDDEEDEAGAGQRVSNGGKKITTNGTPKALNGHKVGFAIFLFVSLLLRSNSLSFAQCVT
jgi:hypothetical protein